MNHISRRRFIQAASRNAAPGNAFQPIGLRTKQTADHRVQRCAAVVGSDRSAHRR